jgi:hypothetical protein
MTIESRVFQQRAEEPGFVTRRIAGEMIVVPVSSHVGDLDSIYTFNEVGARIWSLLEQPVSIGTIAAVLAQEYDAPADRIAGDVTELLETLQDRGLIRAVAAVEA